MQVYVRAFPAVDCIWAVSTGDGVTPRWRVYRICVRDLKAAEETGRRQRAPLRCPPSRCNPVQGATALLASTATLALWNL
jgi:hypothetical protein